MSVRQLTQHNGADYLLFLKGNQPLALAKAEQLLPGVLPPQAITVEKGHGRIETRRLWCLSVDPSTLGLAGAAQLIRIERDVQTVRQGKGIQQTHEAAFPFTSLWPEREPEPDQLQQLARDHWTIENGQHHRRDRTQDEDRCTVRETNSARNLSLFRSWAIFLCEARRPRNGVKLSLPDFQRQVCRQPWGLLRRVMGKPSAA